MPRVLTDRALDFLDMLPPWTHGDPNIQAAIQVMSNEVERIDAKMEEVVNGYFPFLADQYLYLWEASLGLATNLSLSVTQRQMRVLAFLQRMHNSVPGSTWVTNVTALIGTTWTWTRHPTGSVPVNTLQINLPYTSTSPQATDLIALLRILTPAEVDIVINYGDGFIIEQSQIEIQPL